jgi:hypothetical protein
MDSPGSGKTEQENSSPNNSVPGPVYIDGEFWIDGVHITADICPDCLREDDFDCETCEFFAPETCSILRDPALMEDVSRFFDITRKRRAEPQIRQERLIIVIRSELKAYGRPLHYTVLARMVVTRYPRLEVSETGVLRILARHPEQFECVDVGVYGAMPDSNVRTAEP